MRIDFAYCVELNRDVDIQEACLEFASREDLNLTEFHFLCSESECRNSKKGGVRVSGVNHYRTPEENLDPDEDTRESKRPPAKSNLTFKSPHFRKLDPHIDSCCWKEMEVAMDEAQANDHGTSEASSKRRKLLRIVKRMITRFVIPNPTEAESAGNGLGIEIERIRQIKDPTLRKNQLVAYARGAGGTATNLEALVSCYEELKRLKALDEEFSVDGHGKMTFQTAFRHVLRGPKNGFAIFYGGARFHREYAGGFSLLMMDKAKVEDAVGPEGKPISFYVSPNSLKAYRQKKRLRQAVDDERNDKSRSYYLRVYWIGKLEKSDKGYSANFESLAHVVIHLVRPGKIATTLPRPSSSHE